MAPYALTVTLRRLAGTRNLSHPGVIVLVVSNMFHCVMAEHINTDSFHSRARDTPPAFVLQAAWFPAIQSQSLAKVWEGFFSSTKAKCKTTAGAPVTAPLNPTWMLIRNSE